MNLEKPSPLMVHARDIIDIMNRLPVFSGNQETFGHLSWTWAQRAVATCQDIEPVMRAPALLYHAPIVYLGDIPQHIQSMMSHHKDHYWFRDLVKLLREVIYEALGLGYSLNAHSIELIEGAYARVEVLEGYFLQAKVKPSNSECTIPFCRGSFLDHVHPNDFEKQLRLAGIEIPVIAEPHRLRLLNAGGKENG
ncbi:MAG: hypothetical protein JKY49_04230 [Cohaesibacteraceae bacterium]|nr:hypothetical protein [Cohaesibacteraceae bacterium]MBL4876401.1 hypothetical protein [Cohaesibacteraceae bacterium]